MSTHCCAPATSPPADPRYRRVLWLALVLNAGMFAIEIAAGLAADSVALQADALDFLGDAATYALTLFVLGLSLSWRAGAALVKGASMGLFGLWVAGMALNNLIAGSAPVAELMGAVGLLALGVNVSVAMLLYRFRSGDSNMRSVWLCSRNDALGNLAVLLAASGVFASGSNWPDLAVAAIMAGLALSASLQVLRQATGELRAARLPALHAAPGDD